MDLFERYESQPPHLKEVCDKYEALVLNEDRSAYELCEDFQHEVNCIGYTFDYDLDGSTSGLRPMLPADGAATLDLDAMDDESLQEWHYQLFEAYPGIAEKHNLTAIQLHESLVSLEVGHLKSYGCLAACKEMYHAEVGHIPFWEFKKGIEVVVLIGCDFYKVGDRATLTTEGDDHFWSAKISGDEWTLGCAGKDFELAQVEVGL